jgi:hypothetical protein
LKRKGFSAKIAWTIGSIAKSNTTGLKRKPCLTPDELE